MSEVFIGRQPILDTSMKIFAYELEFHEGLNPSENFVQATADLITKTEAEIGFKNIVGNQTAMICLPKEMLGVEAINSLDLSSNMVLEIPNNVSSDIEVLKTLKTIKASGSSIALDNFIDDESSIKLAGISDFIKVDNEAHSEKKLKKIITDLHEKGLKVIAERVETEEMFLYLKGLGFDYFKGHFFTNPVVIKGEKLSGNKLTLLQLMANINDPETDFFELNKIISHDVALTHKLLLAVNKPAAMIPVKVDNINDALRYMGLKRLKFWVNMLLLSQMDGVPQELLVSSLARARFCEQLAEISGHKVEKDSFFLVGLFSALGAFFKAPIEDIVTEMPLSKDIVNALVNKKGSMGEALICLVQIESTSGQYGQLSYEDVGISDIANIYLSSSAWAQDAIAA